MKKGFIRGLSNLYGIFTILLVSLAMIFVWNSIGELLTNFGVSSGFVSAVDYTFYALYIGIALAGLSSLGTRQMSGIDFLRVVGLLSIVGRFIMLLVDGDIPFASMIYYIAVCSILAIEVLIRLIAGRFDGNSTGIKGFTASLFGKYNYILLTILGFGIGIYAIHELNDLFDKFNNLIEMYILVCGGIFITTIIAGLGSDTKRANFMDAIAYSLLIAIIVIVTFGYTYLFGLATILNNNVYEYVILGGTLVALALIIRGVTFNRVEEKNSKIKINRYYKESFAKNGLVMPIIIATLLITFYYFAMIDLNPLNHLMDKFELEVLPMEDYYYYIIAGILGLLLILPLFVRKITYAKIKFIDKLINLNMIITLFFIGFICFLLVEEVKIKYLFEETPVMVATIAFIVFGVINIILQLVRYKKYEKGFLDFEYTPMSLQQPLADEMPSDEELEPTELEQLSEEEYERLVRELEALENGGVLEIDDDPNIGYEQLSLELDEAQVEEQQEPVEEQQEPVLETEAQPEEADEETVEVVVYVDENGNEISPENIEEVVEEGEEESEEDDQSEEDDDDIEDDLEEEEVDVVKASFARERTVVSPIFKVVDEDGVPKRIKRNFNTRMMFADYETKEYYNEIKNYLLQYRAKGRFSSRCETFRYKGLVAKVSLGGKSVKVCLALDPASLENSKYKYKDVSSKKQYAEVPVMIKVRSQRGLKYFKELVDIMMANRLVKPKKNYIPTNFLPSLIPNGEAILATLGLSTDYLFSSLNVRNIPKNMPFGLQNYIPVIMGEEIEGEEIEATVYLDTLSNHFENGDEVTIEKLKELKIVAKGNTLRIKARGTLDRKLIVYAETFDDDALKMMLCTNCTAIKIVR
ncbi:MAG: hypothetical protein IJY14_01420 [Acholeplasmatales bacterium]|nr:hypothetical protein [Acholeplasmatales bacterium]